eukprot:sb/3468665/
MRSIHGIYSQTPIYRAPIYRNPDLPGKTLSPEYPDKSGYSNCKYIYFFPAWVNARRALTQDDSGGKPRSSFRRGRMKSIKCEKAGPLEMPECVSPSEDTEKTLPNKVTDSDNTQVLARVNKFITNYKENFNLSLSLSFSLSLSLSLSLTQAHMLSYFLFDNGKTLTQSFNSNTLTFEFRENFPLLHNEACFQEPTEISKQPIRARYLGHVDWLSANQGPVFPDSVGSCLFCSNPFWGGEGGSNIWNCVCIFR